MYLFNNSQDGSNKKILSSLGGSESTNVAKKFSVYEFLTSEEDPNAMTGLLMVLVALLHVWAALWLLEPVEVTTLAQPMMMEVSMLNVPSPKPVIAPPKPPEPKKIPPKKVEKKKEPMLPNPLPMAEDAIPKPSAQPVVDSLPTENKSLVPETYTEANFQANYGVNPKPVYPPLAVHRGWEGKVLLRVSVSAEGAPLSVSIHQSSGHESLDDSAVEAVEKWKFIPAKKGDKAVPCNVIVPINFSLNQI